MDYKVIRILQKKEQKAINKNMIKETMATLELKKLYPISVS